MKDTKYTHTECKRVLGTRAKELRKKCTWEENTLWYQYLRNYPVRFYRQRVIDNYIVDFYCSKAKLVIELDGSQHFTENGMAYDASRTAVLEKYGLEVLRFANTDVKEDLRGVCEKIDSMVRKRTR